MYMEKQNKTKKNKTTKKPQHSPIFAPLSRNNSCTLGQKSLLVLLIQLAKGNA